MCLVIWFSFVNLQDECSFVSLRDVERTLSVFGWFYHQDNIFEKMDQLTNSEILDSDIESDDDEEETVYVGGEWAVSFLKQFNHNKYPCD